MENSVWAELESFVRNEIGVRESKRLTRELSLEKDLDVTGDDADDFMGKFFERFKVEHGDFEFQRYFSVEGFNPLEIIGMIFSKKIRQKYDKIPLTLGMLEKAVESGAWDSGKLG